MTAKAKLLKDIRAKCTDCCCGIPSEIRKCPVHTCALFPYRMGSDPNPARRGFAKKPTSGTGVS